MEYKGRIITLDFQFKGNLKIRIIQCYLPASSHAISVQNDYVNEIKRLIDEAKRKNYEIIMMGDLNNHYDSFLKRKQKGQQIRSKYRIFEYLENISMFDTTNLLFDISEANSRHTFHDHLMILNQFFAQEIVGLKQLAKLKQQRRWKMIYAYDEMTDEDWLTYKDETAKLFINESQPTSDNINDLNKKWINFRKKLIELTQQSCDKRKSRETLIKQKKIMLNRKKSSHFKDSKSYQHICFIRNLRKKLQRISKSQKKDSFNINHMSKSRAFFTKSESVKKIVLNNRQKTTLTSIMDKVKLASTVLTNDITLINIVLYLEELKKLNDLLIIQYKAELIQYKDIQMKDYIQERCDDLMNNKKKMINSFMNREIKSIVIDRVIVTENNDDILKTDPQSIKKEVNNHFQHIAGSTNQEKILSGIWIDQYSPRDYVDVNIYDGLMDHITQEEIEYHISLLPNGKASGPSRVSYEMIKHSSSEMKTYIKDYLNECLTLKKIPKEWKIADLYPILKPKPWACRLINTRPIVLLEIMRKLLNNIRIIKKIIQDTIENKKELWILALDMAKAYDRVNIHMLKKAMERLKLPNNFISIICDLFLERKNQVFTAVGKTNPYNVLTGIDQGEIISPLLWCIYYDPLLCQLQQESHGYEITAKYKKDIYSDYIKESIIFPGKAYMDDTTLLAKDQCQLETMLDIANEFYNLNDIKINKDKSELLLKKIDKSFNYSNSLIIRFGLEYINIKPKEPNESIRILGVWFNVNNDKKFVLSQAKSEVKKLIDNIKHKRITDKQLQYVFNALIILTIEYRAQVTILNDRECESIMSSFRRAFRKKLKFSWRMPTAIINHNLIYNIKDIADNQLQAKGTNFLIQLNDTGLLGKITTLRLKQLQYKFWIEDNIVSEFPFNNNFYKKLFYSRRIYDNWILENIKIFFFFFAR
ncbi:unnamed protein product [Rhizophagus irregularis]|nr:unnamed protein product [Rhizophagus irregularis]